MPPLNETIHHVDFHTEDNQRHNTHDPPKTLFRNLGDRLKLPGLAPIDETSSSSDEEREHRGSYERQTSFQRYQIEQQRQHDFWNSCVHLLSSNDLDQNRIGLQRLLRETVKQHHHVSLSSREPTSHAIVYGGGPMPNRLRQLILTFMSNDNEVSDNVYDSDDDSVYLDEAYKEEEEEPEAPGKSGGVLHSMALKVITNAFEQMLESDQASDALPLDFNDLFLKRIVSALVFNIQEDATTTPDVAAQSLRCVRILHSYEPEMVLPLLQYTLLPYIAQWRDVGKSLGHPMVEREAELLLVRTGFIKVELA